MSTIWKHVPELAPLNASMAKTAVGHLGIEVTEIGRLISGSAR